MCVLVKVFNKSLYIICSYIPPDSPNDIYDENLKAVNLISKMLKPYDNLMLIGDFNIPSLSWQHELESNNLVPIFSSDKNEDFINGLHANCLYQINNVTNQLGRSLDLVFVGEPNEYHTKRVSPISYPEDRHHPTLEITFVNYKTTQNKSNRINKVYCFKQTNFDALLHDLSQINWSAVFSSSNNDLDTMLNSFYNLLNDCFSKSVPKVYPLKNTGPPWNTKYLSRLKNKKNKCFKKYKKHGSSINYSNYSISRSQYNLANRLAYKNYLNKMKANLKNDPKSFYSFVNSKRRSVEFPTTMKLNNIESSDDTSISNMFAEFFASTYSSTVFNKSNQYPYVIQKSTIDVPFLNENTVLTQLKKLKWSCAAGPDGVPNCILKRCAMFLYIPLTFLYNKSIQQAYFPDVWKTSFIIPLFKSGSKSSIPNYRGIAKLSSIPKLLEKLLTDMISHQTSSILCLQQHGFRKSCSTSTNLLELTTFVNEGFVSGKQTDAIYTDFSKAFDRVNHDLLLFKLDQMGFSNTLLKWINSYLKNRKQCVKYRDVTSSNINVLSGVPQGSHLGPLLFTLFINDLPTALQFSKSLMYADDVKILFSFNNRCTQSLLQADINNFTTWCDINLMDLNINKCKYMVFTRSIPIDGRYIMNDLHLEMVTTFNDLGVILDKKLDFRNHVSKTTNKAFGVLGFIKRWAKDFSDPYTTKQLFTTLVRPILEYGSVVWDPFYNIYSNSIESVQKQFLLFCLRGLGWDPNLRLPPYKSRLALIKLPTLHSRRKMLNISFLLNLINGNLSSEYLISRIHINIPHRQSRFFQFLIVKYYRTNYANSDPFRRLCIEFNQFFHIIDFNKSIDVVKRDLILYLNN